MSDQSFLTVTQLISQLNFVLAHEYSAAYVVGELTNLKPSGAGHYYFSIKDEKSQLPCVIWRSKATTLGFKLQEGLAVEIVGKPEIYAGSGRFQVIVSKITPVGEGLLQKKFLELKTRLESEGLFALERKRPLPFLPKGIGIVTSRTGAAIHDIMVRLRDRMPCVPVYLYDARVQGDGAAEEIAEGIRFFNSKKIVDVLIVGRGGGSLQDLWSFNEEIVVRSIFASHIPIISAVGHEVDISLSDLVADLRAPTPTAAAEMVVPRREDLLQALSDYESRLNDTERWFRPFEQRLDELEWEFEDRLVQVLRRAVLQLETAEARLSSIHPARLLSALGSKVELLAEQLYGGGIRSVHRSLNTLAILEGRLRAAFSPTRLTQQHEVVKGLEDRISRAVTVLMGRHEVAINNFELRLSSVNPQRVVERGYAIVRMNSQVVEGVENISLGDEIEICMKDGIAAASVTSTSHTEGSKQRFALSAKE